jgi:putative PIN family toxin of toxin-antitoxin system
LAFRVVLDTSVLITAALSPSGGAAKLVRYAQDGILDLAISEKLSDELQSRLHRDGFRRYLSVEDADNFVDAVGVLATWFTDRPDEELPARCRDPNDDFVIALYEDSDASMLVSKDRDLLELDLPGVFVYDTSSALRAAEYRHEWGEDLLQGDEATMLRQVAAEGSQGMLTAYSSFVAAVEAEDAADLIQFVVVPETLGLFLQGLGEVRGMLANRGLATRPHYASPEVAYLKLPPDPGDSVRATAMLALPADTIFATMQRCPDLDDPPGCSFDHWRVFGIGGTVAPERIMPRPPR